MFTVSVVAIIGLTIFPDLKPVEKSAQSIEYPIQERYSITNDTTILTRPEMESRRPASVLEEVPVIATKEPFDWKEMISWVIGAVNGVVLLVLNIKNIRKK